MDYSRRDPCGVQRGRINRAPRRRGARGPIEPCGADPALQRRREDAISHKVFVGNLNFKTTQSELEALFSEAGEIQEVFIPVDRNTGRPRGFAFVEFNDADAVARAIEEFDGHEMEGRQLRVNEAQEKAPRPPRPPQFSGGGGGGGGPFDGARPAKPKGSRRNIRGKKRSL